MSKKFFLAWIPLVFGDSKRLAARTQVGQAPHRIQSASGLYGGDSRARHPLHLGHITSHMLCGSQLSLSVFSSFLQVRELRRWSLGSEGHDRERIRFQPLATRRLPGRAG